MSIVQSDIIEWAKNYQGEPFHAMLTDCPYHLTSITKRFGKERSTPAKGDVYRRASKGFMQTTWDGGDIAFQVETWAALASHLAPGAFIMAFAGTRGYHRMACAMEDAGLIIHPAMGWVTLCLSEDTEILTDKGWQKYTQLLAGSPCLCYNVDTNELSYLPIEEVYIYDHDDTAYRIQSDSTDQIVTPHHRCLVKRDGAFVFREAHTLEQQEVIPILETLPELPDSLPSYEQRPVLQKESLFSDLRYQDSQPKETRKNLRASQGQNGLRSNTQAQGKDNHLCVWKESLQALSLAEENQRSTLLLKTMPWERLILEESISNFWTQQGQKESKEGPKRRKKSSLERRSNLFQKAWQLCWSQVYKVSGRIFGDGSQRWLYNGASVNSGSVPGAIIETIRSSTSRQPQALGQPTREPNVICQQFSPQEIRSDWKPTATLATITPIHYKGKVWCVQTSTGAFVARRNGHIFITGNSGFPKSTRIDTQVDKLANVERPIIGNGSRGKTSIAYNYYPSQESGSFPITAPVTKIAQDWQGHRYGLQALKPAFEFIAVAQVPYSGRSIDSIVATGAGALNIDGGRIATNEQLQGGSRQIGTVNGIYNHQEPKGEYEQSPNGRWPANFVLSHHPDCTDECHPDCPVRLFNEQAGNRAGGSPKTGLEPSEPHKNVYGGKRNRVSFPGYGDDGPASRMFHRSTWEYEVAEQLANADPVRYEPKVSSTEREAGLDSLETKTRHRMRPDAGPDKLTGLNTEPRFAPTQVKNNHPTLKPISLTKYLVTLLLPPDAYAPRRILVPFAGTGSEMIGAILAGWEEVVGIEREANYVRIAEARLKWWSQWPGWGQTDVDKILATREIEEQLKLF